MFCVAKKPEDETHKNKMKKLDTKPKEPEKNEEKLKMRRNQANLEFRTMSERSVRGDLVRAGRQCVGGAGGGGHNRQNDLDVSVQHLGAEDFPVMRINQSQDDAKTTNKFSFSKSSGSKLSCTNLFEPGKLLSPARTNQ